MNGDNIGALAEVKLHEKQNTHRRQPRMNEWMHEWMRSERDTDEKIRSNEQHHAYF